ncbi:MAG: hypothetical protein D6743_01265 [Calditrichaeota bacterium]|nr:MAG: hypothetical protein D6743_01265 [Calditrichota bacterium]
MEVTMERTRRSAIISILVTTAGYVLLSPAPNVYAQKTHTESDLYAFFEQILEKKHEEKFDEALQLAERLRQSYPEDPAGTFGLLVTYQTIMRNYRVRVYEDRFNDLLNLCVKQAKKAIKKNKRDGKNYFYLGCAFGSRSIYYAERGKWMKAFKDGARVKSNFQKSLTFSPDFYDAYYGLGLFNYWLAAKSKLLRMLPFSKNGRQKGLHQIQMAVEKGRFLKTDGMFGLATVYFNEGQYDKALEISQQLYRRYPQNPSLLYKLGCIHEKLGQWQDASQCFEKLHTLLTETKYKSVSYQVDCLYQMAKCAYQLGHYLETQRLCQQALALEKTCDFSKEIDGPFEKYAEIKKGLRRLNKEVESIMLTQASNHKG